MGYIEQSLGQNETLLYKARFHWLYYAAAWAALTPDYRLHHLDHLLCRSMGGVGPAGWLHRWAPHIAAEHVSDLDD